jgi:protein TonB
VSLEPPVFGPAASSGSVSATPSAAVDRSILSAILATKITERLFLPREPLSPAARRRFAAALVLCLLLHAGGLYTLLHRFEFLPATAEEQEIPVEVVMVPPPPPPPPKQLDLPNPQTKPPPPEDLRPGTEIPRTANNETNERKAPDDVTQAPQITPSPGQTSKAPPADKSAPADKAASATTPAKAQAKAAPPAPTSAVPDAEPVESASAKQDAKEQNDAEAQAKAQEDDATRMAALFANMKQLPDIKFATAARPAPISGGKGDNRYLNKLYAMVMSHMFPPKRPSSRPPPGPGVVHFEIDGKGRLVSQSLIQSSGFAELDMAALFAVRDSAPFPAPPGGVATGLTFTFDDSPSP